VYIPVRYFIIKHFRKIYLSLSSSSSLSLTAIGLSRGGSVSSSPTSEVLTYAVLLNTLESDKQEGKVATNEEILLSDFLKIGPIFSG
jgi:hypothetical protein